MIPYCPLPNWKTLAFLPFSPAPRDQELGAKWCRQNDRAFFLSATKWSLVAVAQSWERLHGKRQPRIWIPDYFCNAALAPLRAMASEFVFYPITERLEPDYQKCRQMAEGLAPDIFVLVHYFGFPADAKAALAFARKEQAWLVEDAAHVLLPQAGVGECGDFVLYSPHKILALPEGAVLVARTRATAVQPDPEGELRQGIVEMAVGELSVAKSRLAGWYAKRIAQKLGAGSLSRLLKPQDIPFEDDPGETGPLSSPGIHGMSRRLLAACLLQIAYVQRIRSQNARLWPYVLGRKAEPAGAAPWWRTCYNLCFREETPEQAARLYGKYKANGIPVRSWPDLPPEVRANAAAHRIALQMRNTMVFLEVHQSITAGAILAFAARDRRDTTCPRPLTIDWDNDEANWDSTFRMIEKTNLLQSASYGAAKRTNEGWRVRRGMVSANGQPVAVFQYLERTMAGVLRIFRINRGPLLVPGCDQATKFEVYRAIGELGCWWRGRILSICPELVNGPEAIAMLLALGYRQRRGAIWSSAWINLSLELDLLRKQLDGKWRNQLSTAERKIHQVEFSQSETELDWIIGQHVAHTAAQGFKGLAPAFLRAWATNSRDDQRPLVIRAMDGNLPLAGVVVALHGSAASYLIGWNSTAGRSRNANQLLLWKAVVHLKAAGYRWFDLGGIDWYETPGVASFKSGFNGESYELAGEYLKL